MLLLLLLKKKFQNLVVKIDGSTGGKEDNDSLVAKQSFVDEVEKSRKFFFLGFYTDIVIFESSWKLADLVQRLFSFLDIFFIQTDYYSVIFATSRKKVVLIFINVHFDIDRIWIAHPNFYETFKLRWHSSRKQTSSPLLW